MKREKRRRNCWRVQEGSLIISQVKAEDSGVYVCEITNGIGRPQRASAALAVECKS
jgi:hypothetical protein